LMRSSMVTVARELKAEETELQVGEKGERVGTMPCHASMSTTDGQTERERETA